MCPGFGREGGHVSLNIASISRTIEQVISSSDLAEGFPYALLQYSVSIYRVSFDALLTFPSSPEISFQHFIWTAVHFPQEFWNWTQKPRTRTSYRDIHFPLLLRYGVFYKRAVLFAQYIPPYALPPPPRLPKR